MITLCLILNKILWLLTFIVVVLEFLKIDYPYKNQLNRELSKIQVPFKDSYKILLLFLIPIVISFLISILVQIVH